MKQHAAILLPLLVIALACLGCSSDSGSSSTAGPGGGGGDDGSPGLVMSGNFANGEINLAIDGDGKLHVSAYDDNAGLRYATNESGSWASVLIDSDTENSAGVLNDITVDASGIPHVVYSRSEGIEYATPATGSWTVEDMWLGGAGSCSIVSDAAGNCHAAFDDNSMSDIRYAFKPAGQAWNASIILADEWVNSSCDIDVDGAGNPHIAFNFSGHHNLRYARFDGSWTVNTIEGSESYPYVPDTGWSPSIAIDKSTGAANIVYWNYSGNLVQYSDGVANTADTLQTTGGWARPCIALDSGGYAHVFFGQNGQGALNHATNRNGEWVVQVLSITIGGAELAVAIDAGDTIHIIYANSPEYALYHASIQL